MVWLDVAEGLMELQPRESQVSALTSAQARHITEPTTYWPYCLSGEIR